MPMLKSILPLLAFLAVWLVPLAPVEAQTAAPASAGKADPPPDPAPPLPDTVLKDTKIIATGEKLWQDQCTHCHGAKAYPGKAPKLQPRKYTPDFVWDRIHNGFRGMPPWKDIYKPDEVIALVAYILSDDFFP